MRLVIALLLLLLSFILPAQAYFNERFGFGKHWAGDAGHNALEVEDGYIINGGTDGLINPYMFRLGMTKFNLSGEIQWKKSWGDTISIWYYAQKGSLIKKYSSFYSVGTKRTYTDSGLHDEVLLIKYNSVFDTLWTAYIGEVNSPYDTSYISRDIEGDDSGFIIVGTKTPNNELHDAMLVKTDSIGKVVWEQTYGNEIEYYEGHSIVQTSDSGYAIGGYKFVFGPYGVSIGDPIVLKTDSLGNTEWELNLGSPYQDGTAILCNSEDGNIVAVSRYDIDSVFHDKYLSRVQLTKISNEGNILWNKFLGDKELWSRPTNIRTDSSGGYIISGKTADNYYPDEPFDMGFMLRTNSDGDSLWYRKYAVLWDKSSRNYLYDAIPTSDGGFLGAGGCLPVGSDTGTQDAWVIKLDSLGCTSPTDCWVGEEEFVWDITETGTPLRIFPNPASAWFEVVIAKSSENEKDFTVEIFDLFGRKAEEIEIPKGQKYIRLNVGDWQRGLYVVRVIGKGGMVGNAKIVVK